MLNKLDETVSKTRVLDDREILRRLAEIFCAHPEDTVRSLERFKIELENAKKSLGETE